MLGTLIDSPPTQNNFPLDGKRAHCCIFLLNTVPHSLYQLCWKVSFSPIILNSRFNSLKTSVEFTLLSLHVGTTSRTQELSLLFYAIPLVGLQCPLCSSKSPSFSYVWRLSVCLERNTDLVNDFVVRCLLCLWLVAKTTG